MKLVPVEAATMRMRGEKRSDNFMTLMDFINSGNKCVMIESFTQKNANYCAMCLRTAIKKYRLYNVYAFQRGGIVFLIKKDKT